MKVTVTITQLKDAPPTPKDDIGKPDAIGVVVEGISPELAKSLQLDPPAGVSIVKVEPGSLAERAGLLRGDVVEEIDGRHFKNGDEFREFIKREFTESLLGNEKLYMVLVRRREGVRYVVLKRGLPKLVPTPEGVTAPPSSDSDDEETAE